MPARRARTLALLTLLILAVAPPVLPDPATDSRLAALTRERETLTAELEQYQRTVDVLRAAGSPAASGATVERLTAAIVDIKRRLIDITGAEVELLERQIAERESAAQAEPADPGQDTADPVSAEQERVRMQRLLAMIARYFRELQDLSLTLPDPEERARRQAALEQIEARRFVEPQPEDVLLLGAAASGALAQITRRLADPAFPESRRNIAPICGVRTHMFGTLIASENHSLMPVGKHHYVDLIRLQPGETTIVVDQHRWTARLPEEGNARDLLLTLYAPLAGEPELHLLDIETLLAVPDAHVPAWLPPELGIGSDAP